jgi:hypothetical protein
MTQSLTESFIDQLEQVASGADVNLIPFEEKKVVEEKTNGAAKLELLPLQEKKIYTGSVENAMTELSTLFENTFDVAVEEENIDEGHVVGQVEEDYIVPAVVEELNTEEEIIEPTISPEAIESATSDLKDLFEVIAGIDLSTGVKIEPPKLEPTRYDIMDEISTVLTGSRVDEAKPFLDNVSINGNGVERKEVASNILTKDWNPRIENAKAAQVIADVTNLLEKHKNEIPQEEYKLLESDAVEKTVEYINDLDLAEAETYTNDQSMPFTGANMPLVSNSQFTFAVGNILRKMMATGPGTGIVELTKLDDVDATNISVTDKFLAWDASVSKFVASEGGAAGDITGVTAGIGLSGGGDTGTVTLDLDVSELTALGTTAALTDYVVIQDVTDNSTKKVLVSNLPGDIKSVTAGTGLSGGGTAGDVTINLDTVSVALGGTGITAAAKGSVLIANTVDTFSALSGSTDGDVLTYSSATDTISWSGSVDGGTYS